MSGLAAAEPELKSVEITYLNPDTNCICRRNVFCDPQDWKHIVYEGQEMKLRKEEGPPPHFLVSTHLVSMLSEAKVQRRLRFKRRHEELAKYRFGYACALMKLRTAAESIHAQIEAEADGAESPKSPGSPIVQRDTKVKNGPRLCPIHYYRPEIYLDTYTYECLDAGVADYKKLLQVTIKELKLRMQDLGFAAGGGWYAILQKMMQKLNHVSIGNQIVNSVVDEDMQKRIQNKLTGGIRDKHDALASVVDGLEAAYAECTQKTPEVERDIRKKTEAIERSRERMSELEQLLNQPAPELPPDSESEEEPPEDESEVEEEEKASEPKTTEVDPELLARAAEMMKAKMAEWEKKLKAAQERCASEKAMVEKLEARWKALDKEEAGRIEVQVRNVEASIAEVKRRCDEILAKGSKIRGRLAKVQAEQDELNAKLSDLRAKIAEVPPPPPASTKYQTLMKEEKRLQKEREKMLMEIKELGEKIKASRFALKSLYEKLGWDWDLSDSEDEASEKPYWLRRKLASSGLLPFDANDYLYAETKVQRRRHSMKTKKQLEREEASLLAAMIIKPPSRPQEVSPFANDDLEATSPLKQSEARSSSTAAIAIGGGSSPSQHQPITPPPPPFEGSRKASEEAEIQGACARLLRIHKFRTAALEELRTCAKGLPELLPIEGALAAPRSQLVVLAAALGSQRLNPDFLGEGDEIDNDVQDMCASVQEVMGDVLRISETVSPISVTLQHAVRFAQLATQLSDLSIQRRMAFEELQDIVGPGAMETCSTRLPSFRASFLESSVGQTSTCSIDPGLAPLAKPCNAVGTSMRQLVPRSAGQLHAGVEPFLSTCTPGGPLMRRPKDGRSTSGRGQDVVDCGFRPDGAGEESLENWALFKVIKTSSAGGADPTKGLARTSSENSVTKVAKLQQHLNCDFHNYMAQQKQNDQGPWKSSSSPDLHHAEVKKQQSLPFLVHRQDGAKIRESHIARRLRKNISGTDLRSPNLAW